MSRPSRLLALLVAAVSLPVTNAAAASFPVTSTADAGPGSLRAAIEAANIFGGTNTIEIQANGTIGLESGLPAITVPLEITGPGADSLTVERAAGAFRIFEFVAAGSSSLSGVTVRGGFAGPGAGTAATGGGILNAAGSLTLSRVVVTRNEVVSEGGTSAYAEGGGIFSQGPLTLRESIVEANHAIVEGADVEDVASGGGLQAVGPLTVERSTISQNFAVTAAEGGSRAEASGGGLQASGGPVTIEESTISLNGVAANEAADLTLARGGGIQGGGIAITGSTLFGNFARTDGSGATNIAVGSNLQSTASSVVRGTIVSTPAAVAASCEGAIVSGGFNLDDGHTCGFGESSDLVDVPAGLESGLKDNGGPTPTLALSPTSAGVDRGNAFGASTDQRGLPRPSDFPAISNIEGGDGSDIGAFELQAPPGPPSPPPAVAVVSLVAGDKVPPNTRILRGPSRVTFKRLAKFHFTSTEAQSTFQCKVDKRAWRGCRSPYKRRVSPGAKHLFKVRAIDRFGNVDPTPARFGWRVKALGG